MRVFNVPASEPFLHAVITALIDGRLIDGFEARRHPDRLPSATLYLPTQRACRMAREIFLDVMASEAVLLPRIVALGDVDEDELAFAQATLDLPSLDIPPALGGLQRRLVLARLVSAWARRLQPAEGASAPLVTGAPASTLALADDLARLIDDITTRGVDWSALDTLVPDAHDHYWKLTLDFLKIAKDTWPSFLREIDRIEPMLRRDRLIEAEAARLIHHPGPVIAAGSTGSMPSTAKFLHAVAQLPHGAVVLPGLDTDLDDEAWRTIGGIRDALGAFVEPPLPSHPQYALHGLLLRLNLKRADIQPLTKPDGGRELLASEAMRPASETARWQQRLSEPQVQLEIANAVRDLCVIEAANPEMEALAIAVAMREARAENKTAALVTPDRGLARRVMAALGRWDLSFDDSGGDGLMETPAGIFARLAIEAAASGLAPPSLLALLKHPLFRLGRAPAEYRHVIACLELALLRGSRPAAGCNGLRSEFARFRAELQKLSRGEPSAIHRAEPRAKIDPQHLDAIDHLLAALGEAMMPLEKLSTGAHDVAAVAAIHRAVITALSVDDIGDVAAFNGTDGQQLLTAFDELAQVGDTGLTLALSEYPDMFATAFGDRVVRRPQNADAHLRIYGLLEARLTQSDRVILGGLVEGVWPPAPRIDPWLSRPMRHQLGLDLPERRIGLTAHDFAQLLGTRDIMLTHAAKTGGAPAVASRFLHRLEAVVGTQRWHDASARGARYVRYAEALDQPTAVEPAEQPAPKPGIALRPLRLSVTEIEDWLRDPYTIYARHILKLAPLDPVDMPLSVADRGSAIHEALGEFTQTYPHALPPDTAGELRRFGEKHFAALIEHPEARALWWPRFLRISGWFAGWESERRNNVVGIDAELSGRLSIPLEGGREFILTARADRIERRTDLTYALVDYKTGNPPTGKQVRLGLSPQLTLEAAILRGGGFKTIPKHSSVSELVYVRLSGNNPPGEQKILELRRDRSDPPQWPDDAADEALAKLKTLIRRFESEQQAYTSLDLAMWSTRYGTYDDLARIKEWSAAGKLRGASE
ncbi:MAG: double-strand break repair protein AddB [Xanthobacteraceae bacterium]|nr:double-strand break repair protein AddB [Xanthobacteraceae bacterium]